MDPDYKTQLQINDFFGEVSLRGCRNTCHGNVEHLHAYVCTYGCGSTPRYIRIAPSISNLLMSMGQKADHFCGVLHFAHKGGCLGLLSGENHGSVTLGF